MTNFNDLEAGKVYGIPEVSKMFGCNRATIYKWINSGKLRYTQIGGRRKFTREQLLEFLKEKTKED